jgi:hypothetical protein
MIFRVTISVSSLKCSKISGNLYLKIVKEAYNNLKFAKQIMNEVDSGWDLFVNF